MAASLLTAHLLCAISVCKLSTHGAIITSKGEEEDRGGRKVYDVLMGLSGKTALISAGAGYIIRISFKS